MIDTEVQKEINYLLSKIEYLQNKNYYLLHTRNLPIEQFYIRANEREINKEKIRVLKTQVTKLYITYSK